MLKFFRKNTKAIIWTVVIAFIIWGGFSVGVQVTGPNSPGKIFGKSVSFRDYLLASRAVQIFQPPDPEGNPPDAQQLEAQAWQFLILWREAKRRKVTVSDEGVRQEIIRLLGREGELGFTPQQYERWIQATFREPASEFEAQLREHLRIRKLLDQVRRDLGETEQEEKLKRWLSDLIQQAKIQIY